eukprot:403353449
MQYLQLFAVLKQVWHQLFKSALMRDSEQHNNINIFRAKDIIVEQHPLCQISLEDVLPLFKPIIKYLCLKKNNSSQENNVNEALLQQQDIHTDDPLNKQPSLKKKRTYVESLKQKLRVSGYHRKNAKNFQDPYIQYGYGVVAFFNLMRVLIILFGFLSLLALPSIILYKQHDAINSYFGLAQTTLGNLGANRALCYQAPLEHNKLEISCNNQMIGQIVSSGILPAIPGVDKRTCHFFDSQNDDQCYDLYKDNFLKELNEHCVGKDACNITNFKQFLFQNGKNKECYEDSAIFFAQVKCFTKEEEFNHIKRIGLISVCLGLFMCFIYVFIIYFQQQVNELDFILWDLETVTINDYTVDLAINQKLKHEYDEYRQIHPIQQDQTTQEHFSEFVKTFIETNLTEYAQDHNKESFVTEDKLKVMMLEFDFQRSGLIKQIIQRGDYIKSLNFKKRREQEAKINKFLLRNKQEMENPVRVFVTFEYTEGLNLFMQMANDHAAELTKPFKGLIAESAPAPTNIIWQQRNQTRTEWLSRRFFSIFFILIILAGTMIGVFYIRRWGSNGVQPFKNQNCSWVWKQYGDTLPKYAQQAYEESRDYFDFIFNQDVDQEDLNLVTCYCIQHDPSIFYSRFRSRFQFKANETTEIEDEKSKQMCNRFEVNYLSAEIINQVSSQTIVFLNFILRFVVIFVVKFIGYDTETKQTSRVLIFVFIIQFINTDLIILMMNADLSQTGWPWFLSFNQGVHPDFTVYWYKDIGLTLINAMIFNVYWPVLEFFAFYSLRLFLRQLDRGLSLSSWKTKAQTIQQYVDKYSGPEYMIHYKYSSILNITFITFMFGAGMPILFPIAFASFITLYLMERLLVAYSYRQPPMFDETLNRLTVKILLFAPLLYCTVGYWMFNNIQIFTKEVHVIQNLNDNMQTGHTVFKALQFNFAYPLFFMTALFLLIALTRKWTMGYVMKMINLDPQIFIFKPEEQISFIHALNEGQRAWIVKEEMKAREKFGIKKLTDEFIEKLEITPFNKHTEMLGVMTYQILDNPIYQKLFQYVPEVLDNRDKYIFDDWVMNSLGQSDYVKKNLNTYYLKKTNETTIQ